MCHSFTMKVIRIYSRHDSWIYFNRSISRLRETDNNDERKRNRRRTVTTEETVTTVLAAVSYKPRIKTRQIEQDSNVSKISRFYVFLANTDFIRVACFDTKNFNGSNFQNRVEIN